MRDEAVMLFEQDPYPRLGLRKNYRLLVWGKARCYVTGCPQTIAASFESNPA